MSDDDKKKAMESLVKSKDPQHKKALVLLESYQPQG